MLARTMHAITADAHRTKEPGEVPPIQNPIRIATESASHKTLYMPSRLTTSQDASCSRFLFNWGRCRSLPLCG